MCVNRWGVWNCVCACACVCARVCTCVCRGKQPAAESNPYTPPPFNTVHLLWEFSLFPLKEENVFLSLPSLTLFHSLPLPLSLSPSISLPLSLSPSLSPEPTLACWALSVFFCLTLYLSVILTH